MKTLLFIMGVIFYLPTLIASYIDSNFLSNDSNYFTYKNQEYKTIFSNEWRPYLPVIFNYQKALKDEYSKSFQWVVDEPYSMIFLSSRNQTPNAFATVVPHNILAFFAGGSYLTDEFGGQSFLKTTLIHETAHLYQLHSQDPFAKAHRKIFGHLPLFLYPILPLPVVLYPNGVLPTWILEGNAVLNESRFNEGGRLFSGHSRALFFALLKDNRLNANRLTNDTLDFPYREEKYLVGAYFQSFLAEKFGIDRTNQFFLNHAQYWYWPIVVDKAFQSHFGESYYSLIEEFLGHYQSMARNQKKSEEPIIFTSQELTPFNRYHDHIFFLTTNSVSPTNLHIYHTKSARLITQVDSFKLGKPFFYNGEYYISSLGKTDDNQIIFSLWDHSKIRLKEFDSKLLFDLDDKKVPLYFDMNQSVDRPQLYHGSEKIGPSDSWAMKDDLGHIYFFRQDKNIRTLYKDNEILTQFAGYFARLLDVDAEGVYFLAPTPYGQSLFIYHFKSKTVSRLSTSDVIVEGKKIDHERFFIAELGSTSYEYKIITIKTKHQEDPTLYHFPWEGDQLKVEEKTASPSLIKEINEYHPVKYIQFNSWNFSYMGGVDYKAPSFLKIVADISDPMQKHNFITDITQEKRDKKENSVGRQVDFEEKSTKFSLTYLNRLYLTNFGITTAYESLIDDGPAKDRPSVEAFIIHPLWQYGLWEQGVTLGSLHQFHKQKKWENYLQLPLKYNQSYAHSFLPYRGVSLLPTVWNEGAKDRMLYDLLAQSVFDLGEENFISLLAHGHYAPTSNSFIWEKRLKNQHYLIPTIKSERRVQKATRLGFSFQKVINTSLYSAVFPLGLRRFAPEIIYNYHYFPGQRHQNLSEYGMALNSELLALHLFPFPFKIVWLHNTEDDKSQLLFDLNINLNF